VEAKLGEVIEKGRLMHNRRFTEREAFHGDIQAVKQRSSQLDKDIKHLKTLIEEEENDELIEDLESNSETREQEFRSLLAEIRRVASEVRDAKRFNVYKQMHEESNQMSQQMTQMEEAEEEDGNGEMENEMEEQPDEEDEESSQNQM